MANKCFGLEYDDHRTGAPTELKGPVIDPPELVRVVKPASLRKVVEVHLQPLTTI